MESVPIFYCHASNRPTYNKLYTLRNTEGKRALSEHNRRIVEFVASFHPAKGCYAKDSSINYATCKTSMKTFKRNMSYLAAIGAVVKMEMVDELTGEQKRVLRISVPTRPVVPMKLYRRDSGITAYQYLQEEPEEQELVVVEAVGSRGFGSLHDDFFSLADGEKCSQEREKCSEHCSTEREKCSLLLEEKEENREEKENYPPKPPSRNGNDPEVQDPPWDVGTLRSREAGQTAGLPDRSASPRGGGEIGVEMSKKKIPPRTEESIDDAWGEPLDKAKRTKRQKGPERRAEAAKLRNAGHVVSPLGRVENRGRRLKPDLAGEIGEIGEPTEAQLYKFLTRKFEENGWSDVLATELPAFRESFSKNLDELRQKFIDGCSYRPTNRELYEYFSWYMEPKRLAKMLSGKLSHASWYQIKGQAYVRQFYDHVLFKRHKSHAPQGEVSAGQAMQDYVREAYDCIRRAEENDDEKVMAMGQYGFVVYAQFLLDTHGLTGSECKDRIIGLLVKFSRKIPNKAFAREFLDKMHKATAENHEVNGLCEVWGDWTETIKDFAATAMEQAERAT